MPGLIDPTAVRRIHQLKKDVDSSFPSFYDRLTAARVDAYRRAKAATHHEGAREKIVQLERSDIGACWEIPPTRDLHLSYSTQAVSYMDVRGRIFWGDRDVALIGAIPVESIRLTELTSDELKRRVFARIEHAHVTTAEDAMEPVHYVISRLDLLAPDLSWFGRVIKRLQR